MEDHKTKTTFQGLCPRFRPAVKVLPPGFIENHLVWSRQCCPPPQSFARYTSTGSSLSAMSWVKTLFFKKVYAESRDLQNNSKENTQTGGNSNKNTETKLGNESKKEDGVETTKAGDQSVITSEDERLTPTQAIFYEMLARKSIETESGAERIKMIFKKDHKDETSPEMAYFKLVLMQVFIISFFMKYIPAWFNAKKDFISANRATVFRTRIEAARKLNDHIFLVAAGEGASFSAKMTFFSAGFLFISQFISSYNNKSSITDYTIAAGITGGLARLSLGPKGLVAGTIVGSALGTLVGGLAVMVMRAYSVTQEDRHLDAVIARLKVEKSIIGQDAFDKKVRQLMET